MTGHDSRQLQPMSTAPDLHFASGAVLEDWDSQRVRDWFTTSSWLELDNVRWALGFPVLQYITEYMILRLSVIPG